MHNALLLVHILSATVWTGGHLVLAFTILPKALAEDSPARLLQFESSFERIGIPALLVQLVTGLWLAHDLIPSYCAWFVPHNGPSMLILAKLALLALTLGIAAHARLRIIPRLEQGKLICLARHIAVVTLLSVLFVAVGVSFRAGWY